MKSKKKLFVLYFPLILFLSSTISFCASKKKSRGSGENDTVMALRPIELKYQGTEAVQTISLRFTKIISDSRCPAEVRCFWAGVFVAEIEAENLTNGTKSSFFLGNTGGKAVKVTSPFDPNATSFTPGGVVFDQTEILLNSVSPERETSDPLPPEGYVIHLELRPVRIGGQPSYTLEGQPATKAQFDGLNRTLTVIAVVESGETTYAGAPAGFKISRATNRRGEAFLIKTIAGIQSTTDISREAVVEEK